jgi:hypothetical protein
MRHRVIGYTIDGQTIVLPQNITIEDVRLIINETQKVVICSSMQKDNVNAKGNEIEVKGSVCILQPTDQLTIEIDKGDDTTELAKQGDNPEATNSKIYDAVKAIPDLSLLYAARAEKNDDGVNTYSIVLPVTAKVTYDDNGVATIQL